MAKLVRVKPECLKAMDGDPEARLEADGYLWILEDDEPIAHDYDNDPTRAYRSLATGAEYDWYDSEVEEAGDGEA